MPQIPSRRIAAMWNEHGQFGDCREDGTITPGFPLPSSFTTLHVFTVNNLNGLLTSDLLDMYHRYYSLLSDSVEPYLLITDNPAFVHGQVTSYAWAAHILGLGVPYNPLGVIKLKAPIVQRSKRHHHLCMDCKAVYVCAPSACADTINKQCSDCAYRAAKYEMNKWPKKFATEEVRPPASDVARPVTPPPLSNWNIRFNEHAVNGWDTANQTYTVDFSGLEARIAADQLAGATIMYDEATPVMEDLHTQLADLMRSNRP